MNVTRSLRRNNPGEMRTVPLWSFVVLCCLAISFGGHAQTFTGDDDKSEPARRHWDHFSYLIRLKNDVAREYWHDFAKQDLYSPVLYYTEAGTFVINPNRHILELTSPTRVASPDPDWEIYRLPEKYTDTLEFQFANSYSDDPGSRCCAVNSIFNRFSGDTIFTPDFGGGQSAGFDPAHDGVLMHVEQPGGFFGGQKMGIIHKSMEPDRSFYYPERLRKY